ncbi:MAG: dTDP-4-dehydrorhamnose 3,5-epimerase [Gammaproteobacteria bacterium]|jgi:dTDP-4-dehydrorhamnose 3,5-epimerase
MQATQLAIPEVVIFEPKVFGDERGYFYESFHQKIFEQATDLKPEFVQDNHSKSQKGVLRGLHYQLPPMAQGKLVRVIEGEVFDVAVDIRKNSTTFGQWVGERLSAKNNKQMWVPEGFAHGFITLSDTAQVLYKTTNYYSPEHERCIAWDDPTLAIEWQLSHVDEPLLSQKDNIGQLFCDADIHN